MLTTRSSTANESFEKKQKNIYGGGCVPLILKRDVDTRWNSLFDLVMRLIRVKDCVGPWLNEQVLLENSKAKKAKLKMLMPNESDWKILNYFCYILKNFAKYTSFIGSNGDCAINHTFNVYNALFDTIDQARKRLDRKEVRRPTTVLIEGNAIRANEGRQESWKNEFMDALDKAHDKLAHYYGKTGEDDLETVYASAMILDPIQKLNTFKGANWSSSDASKYRSLLKTAWAKGYSQLIPSQEVEEVGAPYIETSLSMCFPGDNQHSSSSRNELDRYLAAPVEKHTRTVLQWWKEIERQYPTVALMARDYLAIPGRFQLSSPNSTTRQ